jgi:UDPglucose--hexose-1-phosphate uridylyltransferase
MSELRHDPINRRWVVIAAERSRRPGEFSFDPPAPERDAGTCPFCPGQEASTPPEILAVRDSGPANGPGWTVRVVPNKYPLFAIEGELDRRAAGIYDRMRGVGAHELIIETPSHGLKPSQTPVLQLAASLNAARQRIADLMGDRRFKYALLYRNYGEAAGASVHHPHQQLVAMPVTPRRVATRLQCSREYFHVKERCLFCDVIDQEISDGSRIVRLDEEFISFAPYASRFPYEIHVYPRRHRYRFHDAGQAELEQLSSHLLDVFHRLDVVLGDPPLNWMLINAPSTQAGVPRSGYWATLPWDFHWHIEILPRLTPLAGFEWGTGFYINPTAPEDAAAFLRDADAGGS